MNLRARASSVSDLIKDVMVIATAVTAMMSFIGSFLIWLAWPRIEPFTSIPADVKTLNEEVGSISGRVSELSLELAAIKGYPDIVEYDMARTGIVGGVCTVGEQCAASMRVRRTPLGESCDLPVGQQFMRHRRTRDTYAVTLTTPDGPKLDDGWRIVSFRFEPPLDAEPGAWDFFIKLDYAGCDFAVAGETVQETSPPFPFVLR